MGAAPQRAGAGVRLVARGPPLAAMRRHGVHARSPRGDFTARPHATDDPGEVGPAWDESAQTATTTVCAYCGAGCALTLRVQDNEIVEVTSPHDSPVTHGDLRIKGRFGHQHVQNRG
ncbi:hypothetical protein GCM10010238_33650 [Streptomyces griseoviridis]|uniref:4Fe-4S Mo/W bis-MGD-type domain-containing protein n=1 Tax=Streptomyces griseoviridis TaxID=45398 RepID=A0A918LFD9_STRGD|nr:hypothetical protein GCM10010238_33650 [Streptomyces niveoruber]